MNLALGSALASIGLTIPTVAFVSIAMEQPLALGLGEREEVLLAVTLLISVLTLGTGRTTVLQGVVHLVIFGDISVFHRGAVAGPGAVPAGLFGGDSTHPQPCASWNASQPDGHA